ncbi:alpha/beta fold hydrolase [Catenuloplanes sp. NPDC051500]|uniref:alpha/beta fold hydrolase n=1 Tax=Catenuloplanes sp. NPDC051500 TaxID=3363959 RepID=UPI003794DFFB
MANIESRRRAAAFVVTCGIVAALVFLSFRPADTLAVPDGARPGAFTSRECEYRTEAGAVRADCGTLVVPENRSNPSSALIALPVIRIRAESPQPREPIFRLGGGPGSTNMTFPQASRLRQNHDVVLVGYRGVDGSRRLDCAEVTGSMHASADLTGDEALRATTRAFQACAQRLTKDGVDLTGYSAVQRVEDFEAARTALGYSRINLVSSSAGTRTSMVYSWRHPESLARSAMISVNPPGHMVWDPVITDSQIAQYARLCGADPRCAGRTGDLAADMRAASDELPTRWGPFRIQPGNVRIASLFSMHHNGKGSAPLSAPTVIDAYLSGGGAFWAMSTLGGVVMPDSIVWGEFASYAMLDAPSAAQFYGAGGDPGSILHSDATAFLWGGPAGFSTVWPDSPDNAEYRTTRPTDVETLLVSGSVDFSTPAETATRDLLPALPRGRQVILPELGHTADFWEHQPEAGSHLLTTFFEEGRVDDSRFDTRPVDFDPGPLTMTAIANTLVAVTLTAAILALVLGVAMIRRLRRTGGFGERAGAWLRVLTPLPLGLGAWSLVVLTIWTIGPDAYVAGAGVVVSSAGLAIGLGAWAAWTGADRPRLLGAVVAVAGALLGAALGFAALPGLAAPLTALLGAAALANLALLTLDLRRRSRAVPVDVR